MKADNKKKTGPKQKKVFWRSVDRVLKRGVDIVGSGAGLVLLSPLFLAVAVWIKWDSKGPVFYRQKRVGRGEKDFDLFKFRSMLSNSDSGSLLTIGGRDSRVTKAGYYIRKYKIDELPQLINVFLGNMSLVGPRPQVRRFVDLYTPEQLHVLDAKPGITDPASIYYRNENVLLGSVKGENPEDYYVRVIMPHKLGICRNYIDKRNIITDFKIILDTIFGIGEKAEDDYLRHEEKVGALSRSNTPQEKESEIIMSPEATPIAVHTTIGGGTSHVLKTASK